MVPHLRSGDFGIMPLIVASMSVTALSSIIAIPLGVGTAIYIAEMASPRMRQHSQADG
jgi:phosphate transport system permease protein